MGAGSSLDRTTLIVDWTFIAVAVLVVGLLLFFKLRDSKARLGPDDFLIVFALVAGLALVSQITWSIKLGGQAGYQSDSSRGFAKGAAKSVVVSEALWIVANTAIRSSVGLFYHKLLFRSRQRHTPIILVTMSSCYGLAGMLGVLLVCRPISVNRSPDVGRKCGNVSVAYIAIESVGLLLDLLLLLSPVHALWTLRAMRKTKLLLTCLLGIGIIHLVAAGLRLDALRLAISPRFDWSESYLGMLSAISTVFGLLFAAMPGLFKYLKGGARTRSKPDRLRYLSPIPPGRVHGNFSRWGATDYLYDEEVKSDWNRLMRHMTPWTETRRVYGDDFSVREAERTADSEFYDAVSWISSSSSSKKDYSVQPPQYVELPPKPEACYTIPD